MSPRRSASLDTLRLRARMLADAREFFAARGVLEVETPALSAAAPPDPAVESVDAELTALGRRLHLHTSPELAMKRLLAAGSGDIYQICRVFRDGELGRWHQPEFTMLEWYRVGRNEQQLMDEVEALVRALAGPPARDWPARRISYADAFARALDVDPHAAPRRAAERLAALGVDVPAGLDDGALLDLAFGAVVTPGFDRERWTFVYDYPVSQAALARLKSGPPPVAARFELFAGGVELANGFAELTDADEQRRRFESEQDARRRAGRPVRALDEAFLAALDDGMPECAGVALGFDRLVAVAAGLDALADAVSFAQ